ncbi:hypothetical protein ACFW16_17790 [Inquilinus sp. NPDC058860]|uniref:hypothetical protein n=1 Tax=Inquilinus sp. NPDC058860 TaxID=3346652 RepID=UPI0036C092B8
MDETQSDSGEIRPTDPDMKWTGWALDTLREVVAVDMHTKRATSTRQMATPLGPETPDFAVMQSRLSRSVRLSIAMVERIRADYLMRREERKESGEQERRRQRRDQAVEAAVRAVANPEQDWDVDCVRSQVRERLVEDEILDAQLDTLSAEEFVREVCRKIGRPPPSIPLPRCWDDEAATHGALPVMIAVREPAEGLPQARTESLAGRALPRPLKQDSS